MGDLTHKDVQAFKELMYISALRGWDSAGAAVITRKSENDSCQATVVKAVGPSHNLLDCRHFDKAINQTNKKALIGHTRAATVGDVRLSNAHPFEFGRVVGAHNGTLDYNCRRGLPHSNYFETDSEALISTINDEGIHKVIPQLEGAWALSVVDKQTSQLFFIRNKERPLSYCYDKDKRILYWASEPTFLRFILGRCDIEIFREKDEKFGKVTWFAEDILYTFEIPGKSWAKLEDPKRESLKGKEKVTHQNHWHNRSSPFEAAKKVVIPKKGPTLDLPRPMQLLTKFNMSGDETMSIGVLPKFHPEFYEPYGKPKKKQYLFKAYNNNKLTDQGFKHKVKSGCAMCGSVPNWGDNVLFFSSDVFLCPGCSDDDGCQLAAKTGDLSVIAQSANENTELNDPLPSIN